jgi:hypothetical protein
MNDRTAPSSPPAPRNPARPVSLFTIVLLFVMFAAFFLIVRHYYQPDTTLPQTVAPENLAKDQEWRATRESRRKTLAELREKQSEQLTGGYRWIDQKAGTVQLPIERAMELTAEEHGAKK